MLGCKWKLWSLCHNHQTLTITTLLVCYLLTRNFQAVNAVTISANDSQNETTSRDDDANDKAYPVRKLKHGNSSSKSISLKAKQLLQERNFKSESVGFAAEWEYKGSGLEELDSLSETQLSPSSSSGKGKVDSGSGGPNNLSPSPSPSRRLGPGAWLDSNSGYWWLFGGQGASTNTTAINYLSDLWVYGPPSATNPTQKGTFTRAPYWRLVYRPENDGDGPLSANPANLLFPLLCGNSEHLSLFKGQNWGLEKSTDGGNSLFNEDGVMWVSDIPKDFKEIPRSSVKSGGNGCNWQMSNEGGNKRRSCNGTEALQWTSYICCDACLSDGNTTFDFCPQFSKEPILWCNQNDIMAFQLLGVTGASIKSKREIGTATGDLLATLSTLGTGAPATNVEISQQTNLTTKETLSVGEKVELYNSSQSHISPAAQATTVPMKNGSNSRGEGQPKEKMRSSSSNRENEKEENIKLAAEQEKAMKEAVNQSAINGPDVLPLSTIITTNTTTTTTMSQIFSTTANTQKNMEKLVVNWWKFDLTSVEWVKMPEVNISPEEAEQVHSGNCRSVSDQHFLYILCPTKTNLLDRFVLLFNPTTSQVHSLGTIHLNNAFHDKKVWQLGRAALHALRTDNQTVIFLAYHKLLDLWIHDHSSNKLLPVENVWKGASLHAFQHTNSFYKLKLLLPSLSDDGEKPQEHVLYMVNPRNKLYSFQDVFPDGYFQITIVTDRSIFLPSRDAPTLINATDFPTKVVNGMENAIKRNSLPKKIPMTDSTKVQAKYLKHDQRIESQISITSPSEDRREERHTQTDKTQNLFTSEGPRTVAGLRKSQGLSSYGNKTANPTFGREGHGRMEKAEKTSTSSPDEKVDKNKSWETSQSKSNPGPSSSKNYNKSNNSQVKATVKVIPGSKNKRILGIKRHPANSSFDSIPISGGEIGGRGESANEMRSPTSRGSLPVNNESNGKPLQSVSTSGESQNQPDTNTNANIEPKVLAVVSASVNTIRTRMPNAEKFAPDHPSLSTQVRNDSNSSGESNSSKTLNLSDSLPILEAPPALKVASVSGDSEKKSLPDSDSSTQPNIANSSVKASTYGFEKQNLPNYGSLDGEGDKPNLENNYVSSRRAQQQRRREKGLMSKASNESFMGDMATGKGLSPLTYGSSEIMMDSQNDQVQSISDEEAETSYYSSYSSVSSLIFFSLSLSIFTLFGLVIFVRRCVKCPPRSENVLIKEPPPIRYSVIPDELSFNHTPIV